MGLSPNRVKLIQYQASWKQEFIDEKIKLESLFKDDVLMIEHTGSTSIPTIKAKPIIDIVVGLKTLDCGEKYIKPLSQLGYIYKGHMGKSKRYFFSKGNDHIRTHHLHLVEFEDINWKNQIVFRDYLLKNSDAAEEYNELKVSLEDQYRDDRKSYTKIKSNFVIEILRKANNI